MLSPASFRNSLRGTRFLPPTNPLLKAHAHSRRPSSSPSPSPSPSSCRFNSRLYRPPPLPRQRPHPKPSRTKHYRYEIEEVRRARPLITDDHLLNIARSPIIKWVFFLSAGGAIIFYVFNLETVPVSGRKRFNCYSDETVEEEGRQMYRMIIENNTRSILPAWDWRSKMVQRVMNRLIPASGLENVDWKVHVVYSPEMNAFVIPGGKVFVHTGILPVAKNEDGLAAILGHEIAHNLARHAAERMSSLVIFAPFRWLLLALDSTGYTMGLGRVMGDIALDLGIARPSSRQQESEADYIGLMMMAKSCFNPAEAVHVWERMDMAQKAMSDDAPPEWLSTHPSNANRITQMQTWLPIAEKARSESECAVTLGYSQDFNKALRGNGIRYSIR